MSPRPRPAPRATRLALLAGVAAIAAASVVGVAAQGRDRSDPRAPARTTVVAPALPGGADVPAEAPDDDDLPAEPGADAAPPRPLVIDGDLPDVPARVPDGFAVMAFENRSGVRAMDWTTAAVPLALAEKIEHVAGLRPAYDAWVVPAGPIVPASAEAVAAFGAARDARWVWTGWVERPSWQLRLSVTLWRVEPGAAGRGEPRAEPVGEVTQTAAVEEVHRLIGEAAAGLLGRAGAALTDGQRAALAARTTRDLYAFQLLGRGLAHERGLAGAVNLKAAQHDLERSIFIDPTMAVAQRLVGELWRTYPTDDRVAKGGRARAAARAAGKFAYAADLYRGYVPALRTSADAARAAGKRDVARDLYERIVRLRPWDLDARIALGEAMWQTGDGDHALRELERVVRRAPDDLRARRLIALVHADRGAVRELVRALEEIARREPDDLQVRLDLGAAYAALGRWDDARAAYGEVAAARPGDATVLKLVGDVERRRGDPTAAAGWYTKMERAAPDDPRPPFLIGQAWLAAGDLERAHRAFMRAQQVQGHLPAAYHALGVVQLRAGKRDEALWYLKRAARLRPHAVGPRLALARVLLLGGQADAALAQLDAARTLGGDGAELDYLAGVALAQLGDPAEARAALEAAAARVPGDAEVRRALIALDRGEAPRPADGPALDLPFGDADVLRRAIDRFLAVERDLAAVRRRLDGEVLAALAALGEGPGKDRSPAARRRPLSRTCPLAQVARPYLATRDLEAALWRHGLVLEDAYRRIATLDELGESAGLTPDYARRVGEVRQGWKRALVGVREVRATLTQQLGRELAHRGCREDLLRAAAARPELYGGRPAGLAPAPAPAPAAVPRRATATIYVDNRACRDDLELWIDGERVGIAAGGQRTGFEATVGQRTMCLLVPGESGQCGDRGTVRQAYLHDGWSTITHCRGASALPVEPLPAPPEGEPDAVPAPADPG